MKTTMDIFTSHLQNQAKETVLPNTPQRGRFSLSERSPFSLG